MKIKGRLLLFNELNSDGSLFTKDCNITIPEKMPLVWNFKLHDPDDILGTAIVKRDDEWNNVGDHFQNKRYSAVFKDNKDGTAYNIEGKVFTDDGEIWYTCKDSRVNITFPYTVPDKPEYVYRNKEE